MKKVLLLILFYTITSCMECFAQRGMKVWKDGKYELVYLSESDSVTFFEGKKIYGEWTIESITGIPSADIPHTGGTYTLKATATRTVKQTFNDGSTECTLPNETVAITSLSVTGGGASINGDILTIPETKSKTKTPITVTASLEGITGNGTANTRDVTIYQEEYVAPAPKYYYGLTNTLPADMTSLPEGAVAKEKPSDGNLQIVGNGINNVWYFIIPEGTVITSVTESGEAAPMTWFVSTKQEQTIAVNGVKYDVYAQKRAVGKYGTAYEVSINIKIEEESPVYWYMGKITKTRNEFANLSTEALLEASTPTPVTQKTYEFIIDESIWFVLLPEGCEPNTASFDAGIVSNFPEDEIKNPDKWRCTHSDIVIEGKNYKVYGYRNTAFVGTSWITAKFTIK